VFDASTGKERWKYASPTPLVAGVTPTSGGVLFTGDLNNDFLALDAKTGEVLYRFNTGGSIGGGVISYALRRQAICRHDVGNRCRRSLADQVCQQSSPSPYRESPNRTNEEKLTMNTRIALLFAVASLLASSVAAQPATKPVDPDQAPIAAVDRFSDKAAHLQLRTPDNHIPGPNQPVDFDTGPFITQGLSPTTGKPVRYYNFDVQTTTPAPVYVLYREGEDKPVAGQLDIIDTLPGEKGYNDFRQVWKVTVPKDYVANTDCRRGRVAWGRLQV
jgi:hypothetical protein